eukprot:CAMPEP_0116991656 /NCGR_PEP_ID=MMETSP0467-20121206/66280_1 /TAXON_ID=283647 /ORGANISM="Mesodinium pulex, Strain SPMC105" /LENGTH=88 /DNA_ID=CAMNT_0004688805 /DNA_START=122 /DNA_END=388 /DNA_ORIENTATION=+
MGAHNKDKDKDKDKDNNNSMSNINHVYNRFNPHLGHGDGNIIDSNSKNHNLSHAFKSEYLVPNKVDSNQDPIDPRDKRDTLLSSSFQD